MNRIASQPTPRHGAPWLQALLRRFDGPARRPGRVPRLPLAEETLPPLADEADVPPRGSAWFDSSWQLQRGLAVTEHERLDNVSKDLPLAWWLAWQAVPAVTAMQDEAAVPG
jgi:hypothetical protein